MISRREALTLPCSEGILVKLWVQGHSISNKTGIGDIDKESPSGFILEELYYRDVAGKQKERK